MVAASILPMAALFAIAVAGFVFTDFGWRYLIGVLVVFFVLAVRPNMN